MQRISVRISLLVICWIGFGAPAVVLACTPAPGLPVKVTVADRTRAATVVLEGTVIKGENDIGGAFEKVTVEVQQYLKGSGPGTVIIDGFGPHSTCRSVVRVGERWIFFVTVDANQNFRALYLGIGGAVTAVTPETLAEIRAAVGQTPPPAQPPTPADQAPPPAQPVPAQPKPGTPAVRPGAGQAPPSSQLPQRLPETSAPEQASGRTIWLVGLGCLALSLVLVRRRTSRA